MPNEKNNKINMKMPLTMFESFSIFFINSISPKLKKINDEFGLFNKSQ